MTRYKATNACLEAKMTMYRENLLPQPTLSDRLLKFAPTFRSTSKACPTLCLLIKQQPPPPPGFPPETESAQKLKYILKKFIPTTPSYTSSID
jgi:hypothetical protein